MKFHNELDEIELYFKDKDGFKPFLADNDDYEPMITVEISVEYDDDDRPCEQIKYFLVIGDRQIELTDEQRKEIGLYSSKDKEVGHKQERDIWAPFCNKIPVRYFIGMTGEVNDYVCSPASELLIALDKVANLCGDKKIMQARADDETLARRVWRFAMQCNNNKPLTLADRRYYVSYNGNDFEVSEDCTDSITPGITYFPSIKDAEKAIETIYKPALNNQKEV